MGSHNTSPRFPGFLGICILAVVSLTACAPPAAQTTKPNPAPAPVDPAVLAEGQAVYEQYCAQCHLAGEGTPGLNPPLIDSTLLTGAAMPSIQNVLKGSQGQSVVKGERFTGIMAPLDYLTDQEVAAVLTYVRQQYGKHPTPLVTPEQVATAR